MHPVIILVLVVGALLLVSWYKRQPPAARHRAVFKAALVAGGALLLIGVLTGRLNPLIAVAAAAIPLIQRLLGAKALFDRLRSAQGPSSGASSRIATRFVDMSLDHDSGEMSGRVREGRFEGMALADLSLDELLDLLARCRAEDAQSAAVLEAYLDRVHGDAWRDQANDTRGPNRRAQENDAMTVNEAHEILGLGDNANREEIITAHRSLMQKLHPDRGGSTYLAAKVNQAKDLLIDRL